jgi:hypothetical protein
MSGFLERLLKLKGENLTALEKLAQKVGNEIYEQGLKQGKEFPKLVSKAIKGAGLPKNAEGYVFWLLVDQHRFWPPMSAERKTALQWAVLLMDKANATPPLDGDFELPDERAESAVENVIEAAARWAESSLRAEMFRQYSILLDKNKDAAAKITGEDSRGGRGSLASVVLVSIKRRPRWFKDADFLYWALKHLIP